MSHTFGSQVHIDFVWRFWGLGAVNIEPARRNDLVYPVLMCVAKMTVGIETHSSNMHIFVGVVCVRRRRGVSLYHPKVSLLAKVMTSLLAKI